MTSVRLGSILVVSVLVLAACGGTKFKADPAADLALAKASVLTSADLPGYTSTPYTDSDDIPANVKSAFATCMQAPSTIFDDTPGEQRFNSPNFDKGQSEVQNTVNVEPTQSVADTDWNELAKSQTAQCLQQLFEAALKSGGSGSAGATYSGTTVTRFDVGIGNRSVGFTVSINISANGNSAPFYADVIFVLRDRAELNFFYSGLGTPPDRSFETGLVQKVYDRVGGKAS